MSGDAVSSLIGMGDASPRLESHGALKMQDRKMTDNELSGGGGVEMHIWKMQDWNMTEIKSAGVSVIRRQIIKFSLHE